MSVSNRQKQSLQSHKRSEAIFRGRAVARGTAIGKAVCLHGKKRQYYQVSLKESQIESEILRFRAAIRLSKRQLKKLSSQKSGSQTQIFEAHQLMLEDNSLSTKIENVIREKSVNAEWAVKTIADGYIAIYKDIVDDHLRERQIDLEDVTERLLTALGGSTKKQLSFDGDSIIVAREVNPSTLVELSLSNPKGIIAERGGWTSHTFILARELNIPAVTGIKDILRKIKTGDELIVDGYNGQIVLRATKETFEKYEQSAAQFQTLTKVSNDLPKGVLKTLDGRKITIRANLDISQNYGTAKKAGAEGIGLFRSEFLFNQNQGFPSESEQISVYRKIFKSANKDSVIIRTFDLNHEQVSEEIKNQEKNPALGLRAVRLSLIREKEFRTQLRALLQSSAGEDLGILLPMISDISEIRRTKEILEEEKARLKRKKINYGDPKLGTMIEVPSAVLMIEEIAEEVDFMNLGTNDLVQYLLAVDRDNENVADWFRTLHPAVLRAIKKIITASENSGKPLIICGEMAGSPVYVPILMGLGATQLSMNIISIPRVRRIIENIAVEEAAEIARALLTCKTAKESEDTVHAGLSAKWGHLFPIDIFR